MARKCVLSTHRLHSPLHPAFDQLRHAAAVHSPLHLPHLPTKVCSCGVRCLFWYLPLRISRRLRPIICRPRHRLLEFRSRALHTSLTGSSLASTSHTPYSGTLSISRLYRVYISSISRVYLVYISSISRVYLVYISCISRLYLVYISSIARL